jgi:hypothetical protein
VHAQQRATLVPNLVCTSMAASEITSSTPVRSPGL